MRLIDTCKEMTPLGNYGCYWLQCL